nr:hypothetical protein [Tanacetum cinerariifolium]
MHPEDDDDEDPEEDPVDYPANGGDDGDDEEESSEDEEDDEMDVETDEEEEEEEHLAPADSIVVASTAADQAPSAKEMEPFEMDEPAGGFKVDYGFVASVDREIMRDLEREISEIRELQATGCRRQTVVSELLRIGHRRSTKTSESRTALQGQITALQGHVIALQAQVTTLQGQHGLVGDPTQPELPEEAGGSA